MGRVINRAAAFQWAFGWKKPLPVLGGLVLSFPLKPEAVLRNPRKRLIHIHRGGILKGTRGVDFMGERQWPK